MASSYDDYLNKLRKKQATSPYMATAQSEARVLGGNLVNMEKQLQRSLRRADAPISAQTEALKQAQMSSSKLISDVFQRTSEADMQRRSAINQEIDKVEFQKAQEDEAKKKAKEQAKYGLIKAGGQAVGAVVGTIAGGNPMLGAQIGGGIADIGVGLSDKDYQQNISQGIVDITGGVLSQVQTNKQRGFIKSSGDYFASPSYQNLSLEDKKLMLTRYEQSMISGDYMGFEDFYKNFMTDDQMKGVLSISNIAQPVSGN